MPRIAFSSNSYSVVRRFGRATCAVGVMACGLALLQACSGSDPIAPVSPGTSTPVGQVAGTAVVGTTLDAPVRLAVTGSDSRPLAGTKVLWAASGDGKVSATETITDANGVASVRWTLGTVAGLQSLTANVSGLSPVIFGANAVADRAAVVRLSPDLVRVTLLGDTVHFSTTVVDKYGNAVATPTALTLEGGSDALIAAGGLFIAANRGTAFIRATADTASSRLTVLIDPATPVVTRVSPDTLVPGASVVIEGTGFALARDAVDLRVAGVRATITKVSASRIEATLPNSYGCVATAPQPVQVTVAAASGQLTAPFRTATRVALAKGESANILDVDQVRCTELVAPSGNSNAKYVVAVINTSVTAAATSGFELRGVGAGALAGQSATPRVSASSNVALAYAARARATADMARLAREEQADAQHDDYLDAQRAISARYGSPAPTWRALAKAQSMRAGGSRVTAARAPLSLGDTVTMKALYGNCS
ncbi:MAG: IPT/TIG domain-containing protein, partial [Gemmatimonas sp.]